MSPLYMIKSHGAWEGGGREPNKPTGVRHAILLTQTAGTSCSQIKHLNFYCAEQPRKNCRKSSLPLPKGHMKVSGTQGKRQPKAGASPGPCFAHSGSVIAWAGAGCHGSSRIAGHTGRSTAYFSWQGIWVGTQSMRILHNFLPRFRRRCSRVKALLHYPTQEVFSIAYFQMPLVSREWIFHSNIWS